MPQSSDEMRDLMRNWFGSIDITEPIRVLESRGWRLTPDWEWSPAVPSQTIHEIDHLLIQFLIEEWDFGGTVADLRVVR